MEIIIGIQVFSFHEWTLIISKMIERKAFLANPKHQYHVSQWEDHDCSANNKKNDDYYGYPSFSFREWTLIISKMIERKAFLANPKHQYHVS